MFLYRNMFNDEVRKLQESLNITVDGFYGEQTEQAVIDFQMKHGLNADGVFGPLTRKAMKLEQPTVLFPVPVPNGYDEILRTFGNPLVGDYASAYLDFCATPKELNHVFKYKNKQGQHGFYCNKMLVITFSNVYKKIVDAKLAKELHTFDGCYNLRYIRGRTKLSTHSWAIAVDHNAALNPLGAEPKINKAVVACFVSEGFRWGGEFSRPDGMHFQYALGY